MHRSHKYQAAVERGPERCLVVTYSQDLTSEDKPLRKTGAVMAIRMVRATVGDRLPVY